MSLYGFKCIRPVQSLHLILTLEAVCCTNDSAMPLKSSHVQSVISLVFTVSLYSVMVHMHRASLIEAVEIEALTIILAALDLEANGVL